MSCCTAIIWQLEGRSCNAMRLQTHLLQSQLYCHPHDKMPEYPWSLIVPLSLLPRQRLMTGSRRHFHLALKKLLRPQGIYSFFQGFSGDNACFHDVCCRVVASELAHLKLDVQYIPLPVNAAQLTALGSVSNPYWKLDTYLLPVCQWAEEGAEN